VKDSDDVEARLSFLLGFIKTFVAHLIAKRALERHSLKNKDRVVNLSLLSVKRSRLVFPVGSWSKMKSILSESFSSDPSDSESFTLAAKAIKLLEDKIQTPPENCNFECRKILKRFKDIIRGTSVLLPGMPCETVLATLGKYYKDCRDESDNTALSTCKVLLITYYCLLDLTFYYKTLLHSGMISVSNLCCPVCWELLALLGRETAISFRGSHSTIYPVELPEWLPYEIVEEMKKRFQKHLRKEIEIMLDGAAERPVARNHGH
jgi:hypothetical protein